MHIAEEDQLLKIPFGCQDYVGFPTNNPIEENRIGVRTADAKESFSLYTFRRPVRSS
jgi:hypothetical protein